MPSNHNILYLLCHPTLTDFEVPILISKGYGVFLVKKNSFEHVPTSLAERDHEQYDNFLLLDPLEIRILNQIQWYKNDPLNDKVMNILNSHFKMIFITLLTSGPLLNQLIEQFNGTILYRFFGRESNNSYYKLISDYISPKVKYIFSYPEVYQHEKMISPHYNEDNSYVIPLGLPNKFVITYLNTYRPVNNRLCFICSKIGRNPYYTAIYQRFIKELAMYPYIIVGRDNTVENPNLKNNLDNMVYLKEVTQSKLLYYHSLEPRHLHYHPLEAIIMGIPVIFHSQSLLSSYLGQSLGKCYTIEEVHFKMEQILEKDNRELIDQIIMEQNKVIPRLLQFHNTHIFDCLEERCSSI